MATKTSRASRQSNPGPYSASALTRQIQAALDDPLGQPVPLGTWLMEDIVLSAYGATGEVSGRARALLGVPETTFRRRLRKAISKAKAQLLMRKPPLAGCSASYHRSATHAGHRAHGCAADSARLAVVRSQRARRRSRSRSSLDGSDCAHLSALDGRATRQHARPETLRLRLGSSAAFTAPHGWVRRLFTKYPPVFRRPSHHFCKARKATDPKIERNCLPLWVDQGDGGVVGSTKD